MADVFGFIGTGNMGGALAVAAAKKIGGKNVLLSNRTMKKAQDLADEIGAKATTNMEIAKESKFIFLGVKPQMMSVMLSEIAPVLQERSDDFVLVSMAAGLSTDTISTMAKGDYKIIRIMPNTPALIGEGMIVYCSTSNVEQETMDILVESMSMAGEWDYIDEKLIDAASALSGCGPAFVYMFIEALADGAVACGLPRAKALQYAAKTVKGSAMMVEQTGKHPGKLKDDVCSPGGSTIEGVAELENGGFRANALNAVVSAYDKTKKLGKK